MGGIFLLKQILVWKEKEMQRKFCKQNHNCLNFFSVYNVCSKKGLLFYSDAARQSTSKRCFSV